MSISGLLEYESEIEVDMEVYISVKNFGKIKKARVNISNFTIFIGNNNSGKTLLMELIYTVIKHVSTLSPDVDIPKIDGLDAFHIGQNEVRQLNEWVNEYLTKHIHEIIDKTFNMSIPIEEIALEFGQPDYRYDIYFLTDRTLEYLLKGNFITQELLTEVVLDKNYYHAFILKSDGYKVEEVEDTISTSRFSNGIPIEVAKGIEIGRVLGELIGGKSPISSNILFLPASRMGLMQLYKHYFGNASQDNDELIFNKNSNSKGITRPVLDFLSFLLKYSYTERIEKSNRELIDFIFTHLVDGTISEKGEVTVYTPSDQEKEIPIFVASSMVNEIVPITKALTDSDEVNFIFYDEIETSMHPLKQIEMVKLLNRLNNKGIRLIVSTHSDTMAAKINNLLLLSHGGLDFESSKKVLEKKGILVEKEDLLISSNIHVYQFVNEAHGESIVEELEFKKVPCMGYDFSLFNDSTMNLFEEAKIAMGVNDEN